MAMYQTRLTPILPHKTAILLVDVQNSEISMEHQQKTPWYYQQITEICIPNMIHLLEIGRQLGIEIMYTTIESLTRNGRDRSLDHKLSNIFIPKGSFEANVISSVAPREDDIWLKKTSSGVFNSTNIDYVLRNLDVEFLVIVGFLTDQCVDMAVRDAADKGYQVICISDACTTHTQERHENALRAFGGYCRIMTTAEFVQEVQHKKQYNNGQQKNLSLSISSSLQPTKLTMIVTTDLTGITRGRAVPTECIDDYWSTGCGWVPANSALTPQDIIADSNPWGSHGDLRLLPDRISRVRIKNGPDSKAPILDFIHSDIIETDGKGWDSCPRRLLRQEIQRYHDLLGMKIKAAFEHEFILIGRQSMSDLPAFSLRAHRHVADFAEWLVAALQSADIEPEMFLPEYGRNQYEITCRPTDGVAAADRAVNVREITRDIARQMSLHASFSPQPHVGATSSGVHLHLSIQDLDGKSIMYEKGRRYDLSELGEHWAAGVLHHLPALCALTAPTPVSYMRLKPHHWSSAYACLGYRNREAAIRICPTVSLGYRSIADQYNLEYRPLDATASPHLSLAAILIAGRLGIQQKLSLKAVTDIDPHELSDDERKNRSITSLPSNLFDALNMLTNDNDFIQELPKSLIDTYLAMKTHELKITRELTEKALCEQYARIY
ncbi:unnamed protein product [Rotaria socialis]|uniref:GS catalytic domain-containing protein n=2 Tax=Rotaria socialis TaxID=392032 RepID=A0A820SUB1_9BILA|nr:unnamed protein product [Rotaria socialis]CAF4457120.1 unnamed protein product [Rotaria socialis]CAF4709414.1 unnamed protein product [Rotaria socialis]